MTALKARRQGPDHDQHREQGRDEDGDPLASPCLEAVEQGTILTSPHAENLGIRLAETMAAPAGLARNVRRVPGRSLD